MSSACHLELRKLWRIENPVVADVELTAGSLEVSTPLRVEFVHTRSGRRYGGVICSIESKDERAQCFASGAKSVPEKITTFAGETVSVKINMDEDKTPSFKSKYDTKNWSLRVSV
jgi:hypothetical protein